MKLRNLYRSDIEEFAERGLGFEIGAVRSELNPERSKDEITKELEGVLTLLGIGADWQDRITSAEGTNTSLIGATGYEVYDARDVKRAARNQQLSQFVMGRANQAIPIEGDEDETGLFKLTVELRPGILATIKAHGEQDVVRSYHDPETNELLSGDIDELEEKSIQGEANTDIEAVHTQISYSVNFSLSQD